MPDENWKSRWHGLSESAQNALEIRDYAAPTLAQRLVDGRVEAQELVDGAAGPELTIPGVEVFHRMVYPQRHRGYFCEFARKGEGTVGKIGLWPQQWATAVMFSDTAKGFHIHPPYIPEGEDPANWFKRLFVDNPEDYSARPYDQEQWDVMFFINGSVEMLLVDERVGMPRKVMRFFIDGDDTPGPNNVGVVIPAGVAHAIRCASDGPVTMVYGTSTTFDPEAEGRIASGVEQAQLPEDWSTYLDNH